MTLARSMPVFAPHAKLYSAKPRSICRSMAASSQRRSISSATLPSKSKSNIRRAMMRAPSPSGICCSSISPRAAHRRRKARTPSSPNVRASCCKLLISQSRPSMSAACTSSDKASLCKAATARSSIGSKPGNRPASSGNADSNDWQKL